MSLYERAKANRMVAAECLLDYRRGRDTEKAMAGALLEADHFAITRHVHTKR